MHMKKNYMNMKNSNGDSPIPKNATTESLYSMGDTLFLLIFGLNCCTRVMMLDVKPITQI